jgi:hypothetical protein
MKLNSINHVYSRRASYIAITHQILQRPNNVMESALVEADMDQLMLMQASSYKKSKLGDQAAQLIGAVVVAMEREVGHREGTYPSERLRWRSPRNHQ